MPAKEVVRLSTRRPGAVAEARRRARGFLRGLEPAVGEDVGDAVVLVVSELVTNALRHTGDACSFELVADESHVDVCVRDASSRLPLMRPPDVSGEAGGFGLSLVHRLAQAVTVTREGSGGKAVRARMARRSAPSAPGPRAIEHA
ncbi:ATP-binding protein [Streptomyces sp. NPDC031705]|uniref:ATP-binding protein n=1 Tax=Streptomyces sp. NPDC031705 TaxID=3155729 RepID=UPI0033DA4C24